MKPPPFAYHCPESLDGALALLREHGDEARPLAGGQSLVPRLNLRLERAAVLIDLNQVPGLDAIAPTHEGLRLGSMVRARHAERSSVVRHHAPMLAAALPLVGHEAIRTRGTIGGSLSHADPAAELPAVALAAGGTLVARSADRGSRPIAAADFFAGRCETTLAPDEILTEVHLPDLPSGSAVKLEEAARRHGDFPLVGALAAVHAVDGVVDDARLVLIGVGERPVRATEAEAVLVGSTGGQEAIAAAAELVEADLDPPSDVHASGAYRRHVAGRLVRRALTGAAGEAGVEP